MALLPPAKRGGTGFTNVQKYLQANKPGQLGQTIAGNLKEETQGLQAGLGKANETFKGEVEQNRLASDANRQYVNNTLQNVNNLQQPGDVAGSIQKSDEERFEKLRAGAYAGPTEVQNSQQYLGRGQELSQLGKDVGTQGGRFALLQRYLGGPSYSTGEKRLDNLLLGSNSNLSGARRDAISAGKNVQQQVDLSRQLGAGAQTQNQQFAADINKQLYDTQSGINQNISSNTENYAKAQQEKYNQYLNALKNRDLTGTDLQDLAGTQLFGVDPTKYLQQSYVPTTQNVANNQQRAQLQALAKLSGQGADTLNFAPEVYDPNKAVTLNKDLFNADIARGKQAYDTKLNEVVWRVPEGTSIGQGGPGRLGELTQKAYSVGLSIPELIERQKLINETTIPERDRNSIYGWYGQQMTGQQLVDLWNTDAETTSQYAKDRENIRNQYNYYDELKNKLGSR